MPPLVNPQHERFAVAVATGQDHGQAYITAGYWSPASATGKGGALYKRSDVAARIAELQDLGALLAIKDSVITKDWVLDRLRTVIERCLQGVEVFDTKGNTTGMWRFEPGPATRALELVGKHLGMFVDRTEISADITVSTVIDALQRRRERMDAAAGELEASGLDANQIQALKRAEQYPT